MHEYSMTGKTDTQNKHSLCIAQICGWALQFGNIIITNQAVYGHIPVKVKLSEMI
jgi:hypothetical protein